MFLSKVTLNPRNRMTYRLLGDLYAQHRFVMSAFPDNSEAKSDPAGETKGSGGGTQGQQGVLYRLDSLPQDNNRGQRVDAVCFLVQSQSRPDWTKTEGLHEDSICAHELREWEPDFAEGRHFRFRLRASPTVCQVQRDADGTRLKPKREGLLTEDAQRDWLVRTAERVGFDVAPAAILITPQPRRTGQTPKAAGAARGQAITCNTVDYDGALVVRDAAQFAAALREGVGRGKAWGCGLLSLARA